VIFKLRWGLYDERFWPLLRALALHAMSWSGWLAFIPTLLVFTVTRHTLEWPPLGPEGEILVTSIDVRVLLMLIGQSSSLLIFLLAWLVIEHRTFQDMLVTSLGAMWRPLVWGLVSGSLALFLVVVAMIMCGNLRLTWQAGRFSGGQMLTSVGFLLASCLLGPSTEEVESRGFLFQNVLRGWGKPIAIIVTALIFAARHLQNPHVNGIGIVNIGLISVAMTLGMLRLRSLWYAVGWHVAWNALTVLVLGAPNSGFSAAAFGLGEVSVFGSSMSGNVLLTGGGFGLEGSVLTTLVISFQIMVIWLLGEKAS
jgi:uncharacterized protein